nr:DUF6234 family protein [Streptomyces sp. 846.5]
MAYPLPPPSVPSAQRRWPLGGRVNLAIDIALAVTLLGAQALAYLWRMFTLGMEEWAQGPDANPDTSTLTRIAWTQGLLIAALVLAVLAAALRAPFLALAQVIAGLTLLALLGAAQHGYDRTHPKPAPTPSVYYTPCYSGSHGPSCS